MNVTERPFPNSSNLPVAVTEYTMTNDNGISVSAINYGAIITDVRMPDLHGNVESIALGFSDLKDYADHENLYLGAMVGRLAGRVDNGTFALNGTEYVLPKNDGTNNLHGNGELSCALWDVEVFNTPDPTVCAHRQKVSLTFLYTSPAGENGFPGEVHIEVTYILDNNNNLTLRYRADSTEDTVLDLTNHTYFNLSGNQKSDIQNQVLIADADRILEVREDLVPTGGIQSVDFSNFDFRIGEPFAQGGEEGYDTPFLFREDGNHSLRMSDPVSGRNITISTDAPAFVMYTCNNPEEGVVLRDGPLVPYAGAALEMQGYPNAVNHPEFPSPLLKKGDVFQRKTVWTFALG